MTQLYHLWPALECVPGLRCVKSEWLSLLKTELDIVRACLVVTNELATTYPADELGEPLNVVEHGPDDFAAVHPYNGQVLQICRSDVLVHRLDIGRFAAMLQRALDCSGGTEQVAGTDFAWRIGTLPVEIGAHPVFIAITMEPTSLCEMIDSIAASSRQKPYLLLTPTRRYVDSRVQLVLDRTNGKLLSCSQLFQTNATGALEIPTRNQDAIRMLFGAEPSGNIFRRNGNSWMIAFEGKSMPDKHRKGFSYIAILLRDPGRDYELAEIDEMVTGVSAAVTKGSSEELVTKETKGEYEMRLQDATVELAMAKRNNDIGLVEPLQTEIFKIGCELRRIKGLGGKIRTTSDFEKMRKRVSGNIDTAIKHIGEGNPALGIHLDQAISRGERLKYVPGCELRWVT